MTQRLQVLRTNKLFVGGAFPRSESGRVRVFVNGEGVQMAQVAQGSRKDLREAVRHARAASSRWAGMNALLRGQILYRLAETLETRRHDLGGRLAAQTGVRPEAAMQEVDLAVDTLVSWAGWCDKVMTVLGAVNPVAGPYTSESVPVGLGVTVVRAGTTRPLLALVQALCPPLVAGNACILLDPHAAPLSAVDLAEAVAVSDVPAGVVQILTGDADLLLQEAARHEDVDAVGGAEVDGEVWATVCRSAARHIQRTVRVAAAPDTVRTDWWALTPWLDMRTTWQSKGV
jgi:acyl-CoA reductase-like NAD-dependent aldehyde dehydrogenase